MPRVKTTCNIRVRNVLLCNLYSTSVKKKQEWRGQLVRDIKHADVHAPNVIVFSNRAWTIPNKMWVYTSETSTHSHGDPKLKLFGAHRGDLQSVESQRFKLYEVLARKQNEITEKL